MTGPSNTIAADQSICQEWTERANSNSDAVPAGHVQLVPPRLMKRDVVCISRENTGKATCSLIASILVVLELEMKMRLTFQEGPFALVVVPYREHARDLASQLSKLVAYLKIEGIHMVKVGFP